MSLSVQHYCAQFLAGPNDVKAPVLIKEKEQLLNQGNLEYKLL